MFDHGGNIYIWAKRLKIDEKDIIDLSSNALSISVENPIKIESLEFMVNRLPSEIPFETEEAIAKKYNLNVKNIAVYPGSSATIKDICTIFYSKKATIFAPTYIEYEKQANLFHIETHFIVSNERNNFEFNLEKIKLNDTNLVFICNPNNPTGKIIKRDKIIKLIEKYQNAFFVIDEAYMDFTSDKESLLHSKIKNLAVLRSFSKLHGLAGLRIGWIYSYNSNFINKLKRYRIPWSVSSIAARLAKNTLNVDFRKTINEVHLLKKWFYKKLKKYNWLRAFDSETNFILIKLYKNNSKWLFNELIKRKILIRDCSNFYGLDDSFVRVSIQSKTWLEKFLSALRELN